MKRVVAVSIITLITSCGTDDKRTVTTQSKPATTTTTVSSTTTPTTTVTTVGSLGSVPTHYTFLDTPYAAQCADAFIRAGVPLPDTTVARSLIINSAGGSGFAIQDLQTTTIPILNIVQARSKFATVTLQFLNKNGFYCIVKNEACASTVNIQRSCTAQMTSIEPITINNNAAPAPSHMGFWDYFGGFFGSPATTEAYGSNIIESQCIP